MKILVVDDEQNIRIFFEEYLKNLHKVDFAKDGREAIEKVFTEPYDVVFLDIRMPNVSGIEVLEQISSRKASKDDPPYVVMLTAIEEVRTVVRTIKLGAYDYIVKPVNIARLELILSQLQSLIDKSEEIRRLREEAESRYVFVGESEKAREVLKMVDLASKSDANVLIIGESGVGKEVVARLIHAKSSRRNGRFVPIDCSTIPESIIESELFGYEKGAFTGAFSTKKGKIELADGGTLFLDEVSNIPVNIQTKLLRFIQTKEFSRIGGAEIIKVDTRIVSATNVNLKELVEIGKFKEDLYYRLNVFPIYVPPLRERKEDIPLLVEHFLKSLYLRYGKRVIFSKSAIERLMEYSFPGNVRELENIVLRAFAVARDGQEIGEDSLSINENYQDLPYFPKLYKLDELDRIYIEYVVRKCGGNLSKAAEVLGISRRSIYNYLRGRKV
jgi:DNA-binding NtrC family response regulator